MSYTEISDTDLIYELREDLDSLAGTISDLEEKLDKIEKRLKEVPCK